MADQQPQTVTVRGIDYKTAFPFTMIFRSFRAAVHPSKLILALTAMVLIYVGGNVLDWIWPGQGAVPGELVMYEESRESTDPNRVFLQKKQDARKEADAQFKSMLADAGKPDGGLRDIKAFLLKEREKRINAIWTNYKETESRLNAALARDLENVDKELARDANYKGRTKDQIRDAHEELISAARQRRDREIHDAFRQVSAAYQEAKDARGGGLFSHFVAWEIGQINRIVGSVREGRWLGRNGVVDSIVNFFTVAPVWAIRHHPVFFTIFFLLFLMVWAVFGGAIARIAAVHIARDEKISIRQALRFSTAKFLSFLSAPIIPLVIVGGVGLLVAAGGIIANIPALGPIIVGAMFFLALVAGFVMTLVVLGLAGGFNLMYPTIAVEGSDSFDAISRSFSYLYARPWRLAFYTLVAVVYGALCYMFIRYFMDLLLMLTHFFAGLLVFGRGANTDPLWHMLWPGPTITQRLAYSPDYLSLSTAQDIGAFFIWVWVQLLAALLGAFAISFYFVANTVIYFLMRREVDATELDDVYLEQGEEDFLEAVPQAVVPAGETSSSAPAEGQPQAG